MKAVLLMAHGAPGQLKYSDVPDPAPGANEVLVRVRACGLNRLDLWLEEGGLPVPVQLPRIPGGEVSGEVLAVGSGVSDWHPSDRVAVQSNLFCGHCEFCLRGQESVCMNGQLLGVQRDGGFAERVAVPKQGSPIRAFRQQIKRCRPQNGTQICGGNFTTRGSLDDFTTALQATIVGSNGVTNTASAIVERNGNFWIENLPLALGANEVTLTATDVAGNVTTTNITVTGSSLVLTMNPIESSQLWQVSEYVSGTISATNYAVWVNGVEATNYGNGTWDATVPTTAGGTAVCQVRAIPYSDNGGAGSGGSGGSGSGSGGSGGGGAPGYGAMCNPCSAYAMDVEVVQDRPERLYVSQYSVNQSGGNSQGEFGMTAYTFNYAWNITWNDGAGGNGNLSDAIWNWTEWSGDTSESFSQTATWPATYWPDLEYGTCAPAGTWPTVLFGNGTNAYAPGIILDYCDVNCPTNKTDGTNYYNTTYIDQEQANMKFFWFIRQVCT